MPRTSKNSGRTRSHLLSALGAVCVALVPRGTAHAQPVPEAKYEIAFNRYYDADQVDAHLSGIARAYPELIELVDIGTSREGRTMRVAIITGRDGVTHSDKPAMWIDGNIHGNEIQASEVVLYTLWYLAKSYGVNAPLTELLDRCAFYILPSLNPDGRASWFRDAHTQHSSRRSRTPVDSDRDGLVDEDGPDDLDGDGSITTMWKRDPRGDWVRNAYDPRVFERLPQDQPFYEGERWTRLGSEGIDNDGDGSTNEDSVGGDDMNRNWASDWKPEYVQGGAGLYPFSNPETANVAAFILANPNIAAFQSYHNTGGMMLRGPGAPYNSDRYPASDRRVYDALGNAGEEIMPYYRYLVIHSDLYTVHGGSVNWAAEGLGIASFTNELWTVEKYFQRDVRPNGEQMMFFRDYLDFGTTFTPYTEVAHPEHGTVLVGGPNKWSSRSTPVFMLEEECHRNFAFTMFHAGAMPELRFGRIEAKPLGNRATERGLWQVTVEIENARLIPTRMQVASDRGIGRVDLATISGDAQVLAGGVVRSFDDNVFTPVRFEPGRLQLNDGVSGRGVRTLRWIVEGRAGDRVTIEYDAEKALNIQTTVRLAD